MDADEAGDLAPGNTDPDDLSRLEVQLTVLVRNSELLWRRGAPDGEVERAGYLILRALDSVGSIDITELAEVLGVDASTVGRQVASLADAGLVARAPGEADRRRSVVSISPSGRDRLHVTAAGRRERTARLVEDWGQAELRSLATLLARYNHAVAERYMTGIEAISPRRAEQQD